MQHHSGSRLLLVASMLVLLLFGSLMQNTVLPASPRQPEVKQSPPGDSIARAQTWVVANVSYSQTDYYQGYRTDCSGFVSMAWSLPTPGLTTYTLPTVAYPITKEELQPGDILNNRDGGGNPDFAHVVLFAGWADSNHTHYNLYEEAGYSGAHYLTDVPYPYWPGYFNNERDYVPMRLISSQVTQSTPTATPPPVPPTLMVTPNPLNHVVNTCPDNNGEFACTFVIASPSDNQATINWHAVSPSTSPNLSPSSGTLAPGQSTNVTLTLPDYLCGVAAPGTLLFTVYGGVSPLSVTLGTC